MKTVKTILRLSKWVLGIFLLLLVLFSAGVYFMRDEIIASVTREINERLESEVDVAAIQIDLLRNFPSASIQFSNVFCREVNTRDKDTLFYFDEVYLELNTWKLIRRKYEVESVVMERGRLNIAQFNSGKVNYKIWKSTEESSDGLSVNLNQIVLHAVDFSYLDEPNDGYYRIKTNRVELAGSFEDSDFKIVSSGDFAPRQFTIAGEEYRFTQQVSHRIDVSAISGDYRIRDGSISWRGGNSIQLEGLFEKDGTYHIQFDAKNWTAEDIKTQLPESMIQDLVDYRFKGDVFLSGVISRLPQGDPEINTEFGIKNGSAHLREQDIELRNIETQGSFAGNIARKSSLRLTLSNFSAVLPTGSIRGDFTMQNFDRPILSINASADLAVNEIVRLMNFSDLQVKSGRAKFSIEFRNQFDDLNAISISDLNSARLRGDLIVDQLTADYSGYPYRFENWSTVMDFTDRDLAIRSLTGKVGQSDFSFVGSFRNFLPYLLIDDEKLTLEARLQSSSISLDELLAVESDQNSEDYKLRISDKLNYNVRLDIGKLVFEDFTGEQITARIRQQKGEIDVREIQLNSCGGSATGEIFITPTTTDLYRITTRANFTSIDVKELFRQLHNFGQNTLEDRHLKGIADLNLELSSLWTTNLEADLSSIKARGELRIVNGELIRFEPMEELSAFIDIEELNHIRFAELENTIIIADQTIQIPRMTIQSTALDFSLYGTHDFENQIDYRVSLKLSDILFKQQKQKSPEIDEYVVIEEGKKPYLHLRMTGSVYDPDIKYDFQEAKRTVVEEFKNEKEEVKQVFREEFGEGDTTIDRTQEEPDFTIEWGAEPDTSEYDDW